MLKETNYSKFSNKVFANCEGVSGAYTHYIQAFLLVSTLKMDLTLSCPCSGHKGYNILYNCVSKMM